MLFSDDQSCVRLRPVVTPRSRRHERLSSGVVVVTLVLVTFVLSRQALAQDSDVLQIEVPIGSTSQVSPSCLENQPRKADNSLLDLVNARLAWMPAVAQSKWILDLPIDDAARERDVLSSAIAEVNRYADGVNLPPPSEEAILKFYTAQIEAAKALQRRWMNQQTIGTRSLETFTDSQRRDARDRLNLEIRPILLDLGKRMASLIVQGAASSSRPNAQVIASCLQHHALPQEQSRALVEAMVHVTLR